MLIGLLGILYYGWTDKTEFENKNSNKYYWSLNIVSPG